jgi:hypothetical protein
MANRKISALSAILSGDVSTANDYLPIVDASALDVDKNKRITVAELGETILAANLSTNIAIQGDAVLTGTTHFTLEIRRAGGGDRINFGTSTAGGGAILHLFNDGATDYEPLTIRGEDVRFETRTGVGAVTERARIDNTGLLLTASSGGRTSYVAHDLDGPYFQVGNNGDQWSWRDAGGTTIAILSRTGRLTLGAAGQSNPLAVVASDTVGDCFISFLESDKSTRKGYFGYGAGASDGFYIANEETNASIFYGTNGSGGHTFSANGAVQFQVAHSGSAVNYLQVTGAATGNTPYFEALGSDSNVGIAFYAKGSGSLDFHTNSSTLQFRVQHTASAVNYLQITGGAAGNGVVLMAQGSDSNVYLEYYAKGTGGHRFFTNSGTEQVRIDHVANAVNRMHIYGGATGGKPTLWAVGSDTNVGINLITSGTGPTSFLSHGGSWQQFTIAATASAVNYVQVTGSVTGSDPTISAQGSDADIWLLLQGKGASGIRLYGGTNELGRFKESPADTETALLVRCNDGGVFTLQQVTMGADNSGGAGFRVLRVPN